ncbi:hypothetical protein [Undibacterium sp. Ji22W]|uniref:hypothetical protein n=1 Tax=Undibacterium sp. Ji22W TaxID=3413038 RepID=UPI003BF3AE07
MSMDGDSDSGTRQPRITSESMRDRRLSCTHNCRVVGILDVHAQNAWCVAGPGSGGME